MAEPMGAIPDAAALEPACKSGAEAAGLVIEHLTSAIGTVAGGPYTEPVQTSSPSPNEVAAELAGVGDAACSTPCVERLGCSISLRGNSCHTRRRGRPDVAEARAVVDELVELIEGGHAIGPDTVGAVAAALDQAADIREEMFEDIVGGIAARRSRPRR